MEASDRPTRLRRAGKNSGVGAWRLTPVQTRRWPDLDLWLLVQGHGRVHTPERTYPLEPGCCLLMRGGDDYHIEPARGGAFEHYWAHFDYVDEEGGVIPHRTLDLPPLLRRFDDLGFVCHLFDRVIDEMAPGRREAGLGRRWFEALLLEVARQDAEQSRSSLVNAQVQEIGSLCERIRSDLQHPPSVEAMAAELGYHPSYFCRLFRTHTGLSPRQFITATRMEAARFLLRDTALKVREVAELVGYRDVHFFSRHFGVAHGCSPTAYRDPQR